MTATNKVWFKNGKLIVDSAGRVILCSSCPCQGASCALTVSMPADMYLYGAGSTVSIEIDVGSSATISTGDVSTYLNMAYSDDTNDAAIYLLEFEDGRSFVNYWDTASYWTQVDTHKISFTHDVYIWGLDTAARLGCGATVASTFTWTLTCPGAAGVTQVEQRTVSCHDGLTAQIELESANPAPLKTAVEFTAAFLVSMPNLAADDLEVTLTRTSGAEGVALVETTSITTAGIQGRVLSELSGVYDLTITDVNRQCTVGTLSIEFIEDACTHTWTFPETLDIWGRGDSMSLVLNPTNYFNLSYVQLLQSTTPRVPSITWGYTGGALLNNLDDILEAGLTEESYSAFLAYVADDTHWTYSISHDVVTTVPSTIAECLLYNSYLQVKLDCYVRAKSVCLDFGSSIYITNEFVDGTTYSVPTQFLGALSVVISHTPSTIYKNLAAATVDITMESIDSGYNRFDINLLTSSFFTVNMKSALGVSIVQSIEYDLESSTMHATIDTSTAGEVYVEARNICNNIVLDSSTFTISGIVYSVVVTFSGGPLHRYSSVSGVLKVQIKKNGQALDPTPSGEAEPMATIGFNRDDLELTDGSAIDTTAGWADGIWQVTVRAKTSASVGGLTCTATYDYLDDTDTSVTAIGSDSIMIEVDVNGALACPATGLINIAFTMTSMLRGVSNQIVDRFPFSDLSLSAVNENGDAATVTYDPAITTGWTSNATWSSSVAITSEEDVYIFSLIYNSIILATCDIELRSPVTEIYIDGPQYLHVWGPGKQLTITLLINGEAATSDAIPTVSATKSTTSSASSCVISDYLENADFTTGWSNGVWQSTISAVQTITTETVINLTASYVYSGTTYTANFSIQLSRLILGSITALPTTVTTSDLFMITVAFTDTQGEALSRLSGTTVTQAYQDTSITTVMQQGGSDAVITLDATGYCRLIDCSLSEEGTYTISIAHADLASDCFVDILVDNSQGQVNMTRLIEAINERFDEFGITPALTLPTTEVPEPYTIAELYTNINYILTWGTNSTPSDSRYIKSYTATSTGFDLVYYYSTDTPTVPEEVTDTSKQAWIASAYAFVCKLYNRPLWGIVGESDNKSVYSATRDNNACAATNGPPCYSCRTLRKKVLTRNLRIRTNTSYAPSSPGDHFFSYCKVRCHCYSPTQVANRTFYYNCGTGNGTIRRSNALTDNRSRTINIWLFTQDVEGGATFNAFGNTTGTIGGAIEKLYSFTYRAAYPDTLVSGKTRYFYTKVPSVWSVPMTTSTTSNSDIGYKLMAGTMNLYDSNTTSTYYGETLFLEANFKHIARTT